MDKPKLTKDICRSCKDVNVWERRWIDYYAEGSRLYHDFICYTCGSYQNQGGSFLQKESLQKYRKEVGLETEDEKNLREFTAFINTKNMKPDIKKSGLSARDRCISNREKIAELCDSGLLGLCLDLHMSNTGASDPWSKEQYERALSLLKERLALWQDGLPMSKGFDNAVKQLLIATIKECIQHYGEQYANPKNVLWKVAHKESSSLVHVTTVDGTAICTVLRAKNGDAITIANLIVEEHNKLINR